MDDETGQAEGLEATGTAPVVDNTPVASAEPTTDAAQASADATLYPIKVGNEERTVTLDELTRLAQQGDDYTRKTQALADQRRSLSRAQALQQALDTDPTSALKALAEAYGVATDGATDDELVDPLERRLRELERSLTSRDQAERNAAIDGELANLHTQFGEFDEDELFAHAMANGFSKLTAAYRDLHFDSVLSARVEADKAAQLAAEKRDAQLVHQGGSTAGGAPAAERPNTIREAWAQAKQLLAS